MFNPRPRIQAVPITPQHACYVIDDALLEPERWVDYAVAHAADFEESPHNAYPGPELRMPDAISAQLDAYFAFHVRRLLGARRTLRMYSRLSIATRSPESLQPRQWLCHIDRLEMEPGQSIAASVLYLFRDAALGGTSFYLPKRPLAEVAQLVQDSAAMDGTAFAAKYGVQPGYMTASNDWFHKAVTIPARWNRLIFYPGTVFHCAQMSSPERLTADPRTGRLTLNGFFLCRRALA
ncbi:MAG TPA: DUF6445 family protein [Lysobacter sp.]